LDKQLLLNSNIERDLETRNRSFLFEKVYTIKSSAKPKLFWLCRGFYTLKKGDYMTKEQIEQVKNNPKYQKLVRERSKFAWTLSIIMLVVYYAFIMVIAFDPSLFGTKIGSGVITLGIPVGIAIIFIAFILAGIYVKRANGEFDELTQEVKDELSRVIK